jgi:phage terminase small subunit
VQKKSVLLGVVVNCTFWPKIRVWGIQSWQPEGEHRGRSRKQPRGTPNETVFEEKNMKGIPKPPKILGSEGRKLWRGVLKEYEISECHDLKRLAEAAHCCDRIDEARKEIDIQGPYFVDRFGQPKPHPAFAVEKDNKILLCRILRELNLDTPPPESRPPGLFG